MLDARSTSRLQELLVTIDPSSTLPAHAQIEAGIRGAIRSGRLREGASVPPTRRLAEELGLSRGVVVEAYQQLTAEGYLVGRAGAATRVAPGVGRDAASAPSAHAPTPDAPRAIDFRYGRPDVSRFPREAWLRALRAVITATPHDRLTYLDGRGAQEVRTALADYLGRVRGVWATDAEIVMCTGYAQALSLTLTALWGSGVRVLATEDPSDRDAVRVARRLGFDVVPVPVTGDGIEVARLAASGAQAVIVTPAHQFPTGVVLSPTARADLVAWARRTRGWIIEDDYDAEYRYDHAPVGAVQGLAPDRVIYAGTASKTLAPGLRLGWLVAPPELADDIAARKTDTDRGSPVFDQLAFALLLTSGEFDRHLRRMRPLYRRRRDHLLDTLTAIAPDLEPVGVAAGLHVLAWLPAGMEEAGVVEAAGRSGVIVEGVGEYSQTPSARGGLVLGYGKLDEIAIDGGVAIIAKAMGSRRVGSR